MRTLRRMDFDRAGPEVRTDVPGHSAATPAERVGAYLRALRRRWLLILVVTLFAAGTAYAYSSQATRMYDATARVLLERSDPVDDLFNTGGSFSNDPERDLNTDLALIELTPVVARVQDRLSVPASPSELREQVRATVDGTSNLLRITARDADPRRAAEVADAFAEEYVQFRRAAARTRYAEAAELARSRLAALSEEARRGPQGRTLRERLRELEIASALQTGGASVAEEAAVPATPATPRPIRAAMLAGFSGFLLGILLALWAEYADRRLKAEKDVEDLFTQPIIGSIPRLGRLVRRKATTAGWRDAFAALAVNLRFLNVDQSVASVVITSPGPREGKSTVTLELGAALALMGQRVVAIEADLRQPAFFNYLEGISSSARGLSAVLAGLSTFENELIEVDSAHSAGHLGRLDSSSFRVLPAGRPPPNPHRLVASEAMREVIKRARQISDIVLIDTPPVGNISDAVSLAIAADHTLLVVRMNRTTRDGVRLALRRLQNVGVQVSGFVVTGTPPRDMYGYAIGAEAPDTVEAVGDAAASNLTRVR